MTLPYIFALGLKPWFMLLNISFRDFTRLPAFFPSSHLPKHVTLSPTHQSLRPPPRSHAFNCLRKALTHCLLDTMCSQTPLTHRLIDTMLAHCLIAVTCSHTVKIDTMRRLAIRTTPFSCDSHNTAPSSQRSKCFAHCARFNLTWRHYRNVRFPYQATGTSLPAGLYRLCTHIARPTVADVCCMHTRH